MNSEPSADLLTPRWLLLIHQIPPKPDYFRVKVWRQMQSIGAVLMKNAVYVLPRTDETLEDFQWIRRQILEGGGEATLVEARLLEGLEDSEVENLFRIARSGDYEEIAAEAGKALEALPKDPEGGQAFTGSPSNPLTKLRRKLAEVEALDFFGAPRRAQAEEALAALEATLLNLRPASAPRLAATPVDSLLGRTWVTRKGIHIDRIACAWFIRRFIDPAATLRFVDAGTYRHQEGELRFDMFEGEFTHEGGLCSFEVMSQRTGMADPALQALAELIHDLDLKEDRYGRPETAGLGRMINGICQAHRADEDRVARGSAIFDDLFTAFGGGVVSK